MNRRGIGLIAACAIGAVSQSAEAQYVATFNSGRPSAECLTAERKQAIAETRKQTKRAGPSNQEELLDPEPLARRRRPPDPAPGPRAGCEWKE